MHAALAPTPMASAVLDRPRPGKHLVPRPLSPHYFNLYSEDLKKRRINYKPGLLPPFYADMPSDLDRIQQSEIKYLDAWDRSHALTDFRYFFKGLWNIVFRRVRSN